MARAMETITALLLSLLMVVTSSTATYFWYTHLQASERSAVESTQASLQKSLANNCLELLGFSHEPLINRSTVAMRNCGKQDLTVGDTAISDDVLVLPNKCSFSLDNFNCDNCPFKLKSGELRTFALQWYYAPASCEASDLVNKELYFSVDNTATASIKIGQDSIQKNTCGPRLKKPIEIFNPGLEFTNYQMILNVSTSDLISDSKMKTNCADLEFKDSDGTTSLPFFLETLDNSTFGCNTTTTKAYVKLPKLHGSTKRNTTVYMVYNDSAATGSKSSGENTFLFFDDFTGSSLSPAKWHTSASSVVSNSQLRLANSDGSNLTLNAMTVPYGGIVVDLRVNVSTATAPNLGSFFVNLTGINSSGQASATMLRYHFPQAGSNSSAYSYKYMTYSGAIEELNNQGQWTGPILHNRFYTLRVTSQNASTGGQDVRVDRFSTYNDSYISGNLISIDTLVIEFGTRPGQYRKDNVDSWNISITASVNITMTVDWIRAYQSSDIYAPLSTTIGPESQYCE